MTRRTEFDNRVFVVNKAPGPTSFDVVSALRRATRLRKVGHTGTLDPLANGVLILCTGLATRAVEHFMNLEKVYEFAVRLGVETTTLDAEGDVVREAPCPEVAREEVESAARSFVGDYRLVPPRFSALKRDGKRMYDIARNGDGAETPPARTVKIYSFDILDVALPEIRCSVTCSRGTYVRSLARDLGAKLGAPAHITALTRTRIGAFDLGGAYPSGRIAEGDLDGLVGHELESALGFLPGVVLSARSKRALMNGALPDAQDVVKTIGVLSPGVAVRILDERGTLLAVGQSRSDESRNRLHVVDSFRLFIDPTELGAR